MTVVHNPGDEPTPSMVTDNFRPDHVGGSAAMVIDGKDAVSPEARTWPNFEKWAAMLAVIDAERAYWKAVDDYRVPMPEVHRLHAAVKTALDALDVFEGTR